MNIILLGISSDIGLALAQHWFECGYNVYGTYRTYSDKLANLAGSFKGIYHCDLLDTLSIDRSVRLIHNEIQSWDLIVICPGTMEPIGRFDVCDIDKWSEGILVNLTAPMRYLHRCLEFRNRNASSVIFFAGGGSNSAPLNVSSYTIAKIALIKATEILDAEFDDIKFSIIGPGWVKTKIHQETLRADYVNELSLEETKRRLNTNEFNSMENVIACCDWLLTSPKSNVGGRNFSSVHDNWKGGALDKQLLSNKNMFKLRRSKI
jgi:NAD(P)-dependent dehydrogenase (short-subunit alcohol dehydrogenase family)